jgi:DNA-binding GntR family transcriptional regulator
MLTPLPASTFREEAYRALRQAILRNELHPGQPLSVDELAEKLGVSPTPIREALTRLSAEGLVERTPNKTALVATLEADDVRQAYQVRELLEPLAAHYVVLAAKADPGLIQEFRQMLAEAKGMMGLLEAVPIVTGMQREGCHDIDLRLHDLMRDALGETLLGRMLALVGNYALRMRSLVTAELDENSAPLLKEILSEHIAIMEAIIASDDLAAKRAVEAHLVRAEERAIEATAKTVKAREQKG